MAAEDPKYPEHLKLKAVRDKSQCVGEFLQWLSVEKNIYLSKYINSRPPEEDEDEDDIPKVLVTITTPMLDLLSEFFEIDQKKLEDEKQEMLEEQRRLNEEHARRD